MELNRHTMKKLFLLICGAIAFFLALQNLKMVFGGVHALVEILSPFLLGGAIAFVLNVPMRAIERKLFSGSGKQIKMGRPVSLVLALLMVIGILTLAGLVIVPGIKGAMTSLADQIPAALSSTESGIVSREGTKSLLKTLYLASKILLGVRANRIIRNLALTVAALLMAFAIFSGALAALPSVYVMLYQLLWMLPMYLITRLYLR